MTSKNTSSDIQFLTGGGEMGRLIREKDWSKSPLGTPDAWPQSLRTTLSIILNSKFPMFLFWGRELLCFYNDAYRPSLGETGKHPDILGSRAEDYFQEIWKDIKPIIDNVMLKGEANWNEDMYLPSYRNGILDDLYWTFSYSPVNDESGKPAGVFVTCFESTEKVKVVKQLKERNEKFANNIRQAPVAMCVFRGENLVIEIANDLMLQLWEKEAGQVINKPYFEAVPESKGQGLEVMLSNVYKTGEKFAANERPVDLMRNGKIETTYLNFVCEALKEDDGSISGVIGTAIEVTKQVVSRKKLEETEQKVRALVENAPFAIAVYTGEEMRIELANQAIIDIWGKGNDVIGKTFTEILPELKGQSVFEQIKEVYATGKSFHTRNTPLELIVNGKKDTFYFNYDFTPLYDLEGKIYGVMNTGIDLTEVNLAKQKIEESDMRFRHTVKQAPIGIIILRTKEYIVEMVNDAYTELVDRNEDDLIGKPLFNSIPEAKQSTLHLMDHVMDTGESYRGNEVPIPLKRNDKIDIYNFDFVYHPLKENGNISGIIVTVSEVTEKVQSRKKIERNEERLSIVIEASELGTWELDLKTMEAIYSPRYFEIVSGSKHHKQLTHQQLINYIHPDDLEIRNIALQKALKTGVLNYEARLIWEDKSVHWMEGKGRVFYDEENQPVKMVGTIRDVTKEREAQLMLIKNEQKFRLLADTMPQNIWTSDTEGNLNYYNQSVLNYSGMSLKQLYEKGWLDIVHEDDREETTEKWMESITTGKDFLYEHRFRRQDGTYRWQLSRAVPQKDENGNIQMWVGSSTDIQDQKVFLNELERQVLERTKELYQSNESLKQSEERYHLMVEEVQDYAILYLNKEGIVENWNKGAEKIKGYTAEEIIGQSFSQFYTIEDQKSHLPQYLLEQAAKFGRFGQEGWRIKKDGTPFWAKVVITAVHNADGDVIGFSKFTHDLTAKKEADDKLKLNAAELEKNNIELEKMNKELQSFAYISSHDLQEPLRKIQTFSNQIIEREFDNLSESGRDRFQRMQNAAQRMQTLINDLLAYSRTNNQEVKLTKTNLDHIILDVIDDLKEELQHKNATVEVTKISADIEIVPFQIHQLMYNLVSNSLKFARTEVNPLIKINCEIKKGNLLNNENLDNDIEYCHIAFSDNGIGFDQQYSKKIFEVFQRLHGKEVYQGTGIGLAIVKKIIDNHKGYITASGELDKGATFDIYIPVKG